MTVVKLEQCPHCPAMLAPALVAAIRDPGRAESCPGQSKATKRELAKVSGEIVAGELAAKQLIALAQLGRSVPSPRARTSVTGATIVVNIPGTGDAVEVARKLAHELRSGVTVSR